MLNPTMSEAVCRDQSRSPPTGASAMRDITSARLVASSRSIIVPLCRYIWLRICYLSWIAVHLFARRRNIRRICHSRLFLSGNSHAKYALRRPTPERFFWVHRIHHYSL